MTIFHSIARFLGFQSGVVLSEKLVAGLGGILAITAVYVCSWYWTGYQGSMAILPSMGAATVLLFAVPHGQLSTPWALFGGNTLSAFAGVSAALLIDNPFVAASIGVGLAILLMHLGRCLHPPGGATALAAVIGGDTLTGLGYWYVLTPTLVNCAVLFVTAMLFNNLFHWRRYPISRMRYQGVAFSPDTAGIKLHHIHEAIARSEVVVDVSDEQIKRIVDHADEIMRKEALLGFDLEVGAFYTNARPGLKWSVRQVVDARPHDNPEQYRVIYRTVDGARKGESGDCSLLAFAEWANEKVRPGRR